MTRAILRSDSFEPDLNLAVEEALLDGLEPDASILLVYVNDPCVVIGRNQNPWAEVAENAGLPLFRRISGGGTVYHDRGTLIWSILTPRQAHDQSEELAFVARGLRRLGLELAAGPRGGLFVASDGPCSGHKVAGTARRIGARSVMHHGTLLVDADLGRLGACLGGIDAAETRALPSVASPVANLAGLAPGIGLEEVAFALAEEFLGGARASGAAAGAAWGDAIRAADPGVVSGARERLRSWNWTWGETPAFSLELTIPTGSSEGTFWIEVRSGLVTSCSAAGSFEDILGKPFDYALSRRIEAVLSGERCAIQPQEGRS